MTTKGCYADVRVSASRRPVSSCVRRPIPARRPVFDPPSSRPSPALHLGPPARHFTLHPQVPLDVPRAPPEFGRSHSLAANAESKVSTARSGAHLGLYRPTVHRHIMATISTTLFCFSRTRWTASCWPIATSRYFGL